MSRMLYYDRDEIPEGLDLITITEDFFFPSIVAHSQQYITIDDWVNEHASAEVYFCRYHETGDVVHPHFSYDSTTKKMTSTSKTCKMAIFYWTLAFSNPSDAIAFLFVFSDSYERIVQPAHMKQRATYLHWKALG